MKALVWKDIGEIELVDRPMPELCSDKDAIIKVVMSSICTSDLHIIKGFVPKASKGIVLGHEFVGVVVDSLMLALVFELYAYPVVELGAPSPPFAL